MILEWSLPEDVYVRIPRESGDDPRYWNAVDLLPMYSPRERG